jgi:hypothetical protein
MKFRAPRSHVQVQKVLMPTPEDVEKVRAAIQLKDESDRAKEKRWMTEQGRTHRTIVEIGSEWGDSTRAIATENSGIVYQLICGQTICLGIIPGDIREAAWLLVTDSNSSRITFKGVISNRCK